MKSLIDFWIAVLAEAGTKCNISTERDSETVTSRVKGEGLVFLTITLPAYCKDFERSLDVGRIESDAFPSFGRKGAHIPRLFSGFLEQVFDSGTGCLLDEPSIEAIRCVRQLTNMVGKVNLPCSDKRVEAAYAQFIETEQIVTECDALRTEEEISQFRQMSKLLWTDILCDVDQAIYNLDVVPKHGPGATADRITGNRKFDTYSWTERLEEIFPAGEFLLPNWRGGLSHPFDRVTWKEPGAEIPVRVIHVPKTQKTPRLIAIEPLCMQYAQQAVSERLMKVLQSTRVGWVRHHRVYNPMKHFIGFDDQGPNQAMAQKGSSDGTLATLDLSEASDRVSYQLVNVMLENHPWLARAVDATRSRRADVRGYGVVPLSKFASMGSALCFPIEAMVFVTLTMLGIQEGLKHQLTRRDLGLLKGRVRVYGDDIVVPVEFVAPVIDSLEAYGLKVNTGKSFWTGRFRESCGKEYYDGEDVTLSRIRNPFPTSRADVTEIVSMVSLRNQLYAGGWWKTVFDVLDPWLETLLGGYFPVVGPDSPVLGRHSFLGYESQKMCSRHHSPLVKGWVVKSKSPSSLLEDEGALLKWFLKRGEKPFAMDHLERQGRPDAVYIKLRWAPAY